jgi:hypothetical protein
MKKILALIFTLLPIIAMAGPKIQVLETHWEYGNIPQNCVVTHAYQIKNIGDDTLRIADVKPG